MKHKISATGAYMLAASLLTADAALAQGTVQLARRAGPAVVTLKVFDAAGNHLGEGSGFFIAGGRIVTNTHVVEGAARVEVFGSEDMLLGAVRHAEALSSPVDIAILPAIGTAPGTLTLASSLPEPGEDVVVIGAPLGLTNTVSTGIVSAVRRGRGATWIQITAPISSGSSGGPVLNSTGEVIGVAVATLEEGQGLNFAVPARAVEALVQSPPGRVAFPAFQTAASGSTAALSETRAEIRIGETIQGTLDPRDIEIDGSYVDAYDFAGTAGQRVVITLRSDAIDGYLGLFARDDLDWYVADDDSGEGRNARISTTLPRTGTYVVAATSYEGGETGPYTLTLGQETGPTLTAQSSPARDGWVIIAESDDATHSYLPRSVRQTSGNAHEAWSRTVYRTAQQDGVGDYPYDSAKVLWRIDCNTRRVGLVSATTYLGSGIVESHTVESIQEKPVVPGSTGEQLLRHVCSR